jgi:hypothetical protein
MLCHCIKIHIPVAETCARVANVISSGMDPRGARGDIRSCSRGSVRVSTHYFGVLQVVITVSGLCTVLGTCR